MEYVSTAYLDRCLQRRYQHLARYCRQRQRPSRTKARYDRRTINRRDQPATISAKAVGYIKHGCNHTTEIRRISSAARFEGLDIGHAVNEFDRDESSDIRTNEVST